MPGIPSQPKIGRDHGFAIGCFSADGHVGTSAGNTLLGIFETDRADGSFRVKLVDVRALNTMGYS